MSRAVFSHVSSAQRPAAGGELGAQSRVTGGPDRTGDGALVVGVEERRAAATSGED